MQLKRFVTYLLFLTLAIYNLCPLLMQGDCGFAPPESISVSDSESHCHSDADSIAPTFTTICCDATHDCEDSSEDSPRQNSPHIGTCCVIGLELLNPGKSDNLSYLLRTTLLPIGAIPEPYTVPPLCESLFHPVEPAKHHSDYLLIHPISLRGPPLSLS